MYVNNNINSLKQLKWDSYGTSQAIERTDRKNKEETRGEVLEVESGVADVSNLVGYDATLLDSWFPTFRGKVFILSSGGLYEQEGNSP
jgi:hypothetical protein